MRTAFHLLTATTSLDFIVKLLSHCICVYEKWVCVFSVGEFNSETFWLSFRYRSSGSWSRRWTLLHRTYERKWVDIVFWLNVIFSHRFIQEPVMNLLPLSWSNGEAETSSSLFTCVFSRKQFAPVGAGPSYLSSSSQQEKLMFCLIFVLFAPKRNLLCGITLILSKNQSFAEKTFMIFFIVGISRIGDNKRVAQVELLSEEQLLVIISGT